METCQLKLEYMKVIVGYSSYGLIEMAHSLWDHLLLNFIDI